MSYLRSIQGETDFPDVFRKYPRRSALILRALDGVGVDVSSEQARNTGATLLPTVGYGGLAEELEKIPV